MNKEQAAKVLGEAIKPDGSLYSLGWYLSWTPCDGDAVLDGEFTAEDLEAIAYWMRGASQPEAPVCQTHGPLCLRQECVADQPNAAAEGTVQDTPNVG